MRGEFLGVWAETWREIWTPLIDSANEAEEVSADVFCELYRELSPALRMRLSIEDLADTLDDPRESRQAFERVRTEDIRGERSLIGFFERLHDVLNELGGDPLSNRYFNLLVAFVEKYSLRYDLRRPCVLCPTLTGVFSSLVRDLGAITRQDPHLNTLMHDFENAMRDLRHDRSDGRIRTCIQKQFNLMEALGSTSPGVTATELGAICNQLGSWPHGAVKASLRSLYGFASDYPGIRHGGNPASAMRTVDMRDMIAVSVLLAGFAPYISAALNAEAVYEGT